MRLSSDYTRLSMLPSDQNEAFRQIQSYRSEIMSMALAGNPDAIADRLTEILADLGAEPGYAALNMPHLARLLVREADYGAELLSVEFDSVSLEMLRAVNAAIRKAKERFQ